MRQYKRWSPKLRLPIAFGRILRSAHRQLRRQHRGHGNANNIGLRAIEESGGRHYRKTAVGFDRSNRLCRHMDCPAGKAREELRRPGKVELSNTVEKHEYDVHDLTPRLVIPHQVEDDNSQSSTMPALSSKRKGPPDCSGGPYVPGGWNVTSKSHDRL